jgi:hypothetical protein
MKELVLKRRKNKDIGADETDIQNIYKRDQNKRGINEGRVLWPLSTINH